MSSARRSSAGLLAAALLVAGSATARAAVPGTAAAASAPYTMDAPVDVVLTDRVSSETARPGDTFTFKTAKDVRLGDVTLPAGTPGSGRLATAVAATRSAAGQLALQADELMGPTTVWVNIDSSVTPRGHYSSKRDIVLDPGVAFRVVTILPRRTMAPLVGTQPVETPMPATSAPGGSPTGGVPAPLVSTGPVSGAAAPSASAPPSPSASP